MITFSGMSIGSDVRLDEKTRNLLIELVKSRPILYNDCTDRTRESVDERQQAWDEVGAKLKLPSEVCKYKFTTLKNNYYKNMKNDSVGPDMRRRLEYLNDLAPWNRIQTEKPARITQRRTTKRIRHDYNEESNSDILLNTSTASVFDLSSHDLGPHFKEPNGTDVNGEHTAQSTPNNGQYGPNGNRCDDNHNVESYSTKQNGHGTEKSMSYASQQFGAEPADDLTSFFKNMEQTTRKFSARLQVKVKRMISDIIYDAEDQWLNSQASSLP